MEYRTEQLHLSNSITQQIKKRKRLEGEYDEYSRRTMPHTVLEQCSESFAKCFHDRAITCIELANIYWLNRFGETAISYIENGIADLIRAQDIYKKLDNKQSEKNAREIQKCYSLENLFFKHIKFIKQETRADDFITHSDTPQKKSLATEGLVDTPQKSASNRMLPTCSPEKLKKSKPKMQSQFQGRTSPICSLISIFEQVAPDKSNPIDQGMTYRI